MKTYLTHVNTMDERALDILFDEDFNKEFDEANEIDTFVMLNESPIKGMKQPWGNRSKDRTIEDIYDDAVALAKKGKAMLKSGLKWVVKKIHEPKVLVDIKSMKSFKNKVVQRGQKAETITDILRAAVLLKEPGDVLKTVAGIKKKFDVVKYEEKIKGKDKKYGYYGSHHFILKVNGVAVETQIMTKKLWSYKEAAHQIYNAQRTPGATGTYAKKDRTLSKQIFSKGNRPVRR